LQCASSEALRKAVNVDFHHGLGLIPGGVTCRDRDLYRLGGVVGDCLVLERTKLR
jgi:hypothetical protein